MKAPLDDAATEPDGLVRIPPTTDERAIGALLEGLDEPQALAPARMSGPDLRPRSQRDTALLPDVDRRQRRKGAVLGLVLGLVVTLIAGTVALKTVFTGRNADAAATSVPTAPAAPAAAAAAVATTHVVAVTPLPSSAVASSPIPTVAPPNAAVTDLPLVPPPSAPSASAAAPSTAKRPAHPASSSSPGEPRRGYGLTSDEP